MSEFPKNQAQVTGEVTRSRQHEFSEGRIVVNLNLSVLDDRDRTTFINVVCFDDVGEVVRGVKDGTRVYAKGGLQKAKDWVDKEGNKRYGNLEVIADEITILGKREGGEPKKASEKIKF